MVRLALFVHWLRGLCLELSLAMDSSKVGLESCFILDLLKFYFLIHIINCLGITCLIYFYFKFLWCEINI